MGNNTKKAKVPEICLIAPSQSLADLTRRVAADRRSSALTRALTSKILKGFTI